jgi:RNA polymerase sigma factor (sigma-70 family)
MARDPNKAGFGAADPDRPLLAAALAGAPGAAERLTRALADLVFTACLRVTASPTEAEAAFREVMAELGANGFVRLKLYDGRANVRVYVALVVRDLLLARAINLLVRDAARGWRAFEAFFGADLARMIERALPGAANRQNREDAYQAVSAALLENDLKRLRAYSGRGSPSGFVLHVLENLVVDFARTIVPRRRLPAAVERLAPLAQAVYRLIYWQQLDADPALLARHLSRPPAPPPTVAAVAAAVAQLREALPASHYAPPRREGQMLELSAMEEFALAGGSEDFRVATPEDSLVADESAELLEQALDVLQAMVPALVAAERLYLQLALAGAPAREIARLMCLPVEEVHRLAQKLKRRLRAELGEAEVVKRWRLSV